MKRDRSNKESDTGAVTFGRGFLEEIRSGNFDQGPREMHTAKCADCGKECNVPFKPREGRPVFCRECYPKHRKPSY